jgi:hypothetical protein
MVEIIKSAGDYPFFHPGNSKVRYLSGGRSELLHQAISGIGTTVA